METKNIEKFFLNTLLRISILGVILILVSNIIVNPQDRLSITTSFAILLTSIGCYKIREKYPSIAVLILTSVILAAMIYQRLASPATTTTLSIVLITGFIISVMLRGKAFWIMHGLALTILNTVFIYELQDPITAAITYSTLYLILVYATRILKFNYDNIHESLTESNLKIQQKAAEIAVQNEELLRIQDNLTRLNINLEQIVNERTAKIQIQNEILIKYSYTNAHHLRGPVARLLGLASIYKLDTKPEPDFYISKMVDQAREIDSVVQQINLDLESHNVQVS